MTILVHSLLETASVSFPDKVALVCDDYRITYLELNALSEHLANELLERGLKQQDRIVIFLENSVELVISLYAVLKAGGVMVILHPGMKSEKLGFILNDTEAFAIITHAGKSSIIKDAVMNASVVKHIFWCGQNIFKIPVINAVNSESWESIFSKKGSLFCRPKRNIIDIDLASIIYTSGSTGEPKGVVSAHYNIVAVATSITTYLKNQQEDIILSTLPLCFGYGLYQVLATPLFGGTIILEKSFLYPFKIIERIVKENVTGFPIIPTMAAILIQMKNLYLYDFSSLRYITNAAAALPLPNVRKLQKLFPKTSIFSMYGLTECVRALYLPPEELERRPDSVGIPIPNEEVYLVDQNGNILGPDETGELVVRGIHVMQGYWKRPKETANTFRQGKYRGETLLYTGDLFRKDNEEFYYFVGRKDDMIKTKGERVSPKEVEDVLCAIPGVAEAAVVGVPDDIMGQAIRAYVVLEKQVEKTADDILKFCLKHIEPYMLPKEVVFRESLPKTPNGKINKVLLKSENIS